MLLFPRNSFVLLLLCAWQLQAMSSTEFHKKQNMHPDQTPEEDDEDISRKIDDFYYGSWDEL